MRLFLIATIAFLCLASSVGAAVIGASWVADIPFPQYAHFWSDSSLIELGPQEQMDDEAIRRALGGSCHVYLKNTATGPITFDDVMLGGIGLNRAIAFNRERKYKGVAYAASIFFSDLTEAERKSLIEAGEPIWYKIEPRTIAPSATGEITIRLRHTPSASLQLAVKTSAGMEDVTVPMKAQPSIEGISFSESLDRVYLYVHYGGVSRVLMDGMDVTALSAIGRDPALEITPIVIKPKSPLARGSYHSFQTVHDDATTAISGIRAYADDLIYGVWGAKPGKESDLELGRAHVTDMGVHNINMQMEIIGSDAVRAYMKSAEGVQAMKSLGIRMIVGEPDKAWPGALAWYLADEPDTADFRIERLPPQSRVGAIGQGLVEHAETLRQADQSVPNMLNVDMTFKPDNWYVYGQLPDIFAADPYMQTRLAQAYWTKPGMIPYYSRATFVYGVGSVCRSSCAPKPLHLMLNSTKLIKGDKVFRFATPEEKRIELYYALASGATSFSYWWLVPSAKDGDGSSGCMADEPEAKALWHAIGLLGAEVRTAGPILTRSCPARVPTNASRWLWTRALIAGTDAMVLLIVNDNYASDRLGIVIQPVEDAQVSVDLPEWLSAKSVFEIDWHGIHDVHHDQTGSKLNLALGTVDVARMVVVTSDPGLRSELQSRYDRLFRANVELLTAARRIESAE